MMPILYISDFSGLPEQVFYYELIVFNSIGDKNVLVPFTMQVYKL